MPTTIWKRLRAARTGAFCLLASGLLQGCAEESSPPSESVPVAESVSAAVPASEQQTSAQGMPASESGKDEGGSFELKPLTLGGPSAGGDGASASGTNAASQNKEKQIQAIISRLQPLQILLGQWRGTTRREFENFKAVDNHDWVWDLRTDPESPALTISSDKSPYLKQGRLSWDVTQEKFTLNATDASGVERFYVGDFSEPVQEIVGSDDKLHKVFRLEFNQQQTGGAEAELWQLAFAQQENNRYLLEIAKKRGNADFARYDTVSTQREGTSFAMSDSDYAEKTCIISEGLGTTELTYKGRSYWVCCSGCKAAFEEDPEAWIARAAARDKK